MQIESTSANNEVAQENGNVPVAVAKTRTSAKEAVSSRWASRAEQSTRGNAARQHQQQQPPHPPGQLKKQMKQPLQSQQQEQEHQQKQKQQPVQVLIHPPTNLICQTWKQVQNAIGFQLLRQLDREQKLHKPKPMVPLPKKTGPPPLKRTLTINKQQLANTLANIRVSTALQNQLADITTGESKNYLKSILSILPAGFDETSALTSSIQNRKRAFMLMDLGRVIRAHAQFITFTCGFEDVSAGDLPPTHKLRRMGQNSNNVARKRKGVYIQPQFKVMKNPSVELLKLLTRLGVDLRCNTSDDVLAASQAVNEERRERAGDRDEDILNVQFQYGEEAMVLVDDVSKTRKPNGYFRRLLQAQYSNHATSYVEVAVDSVDEVHRISNTARTFARRNNSNTEIEGCRFMLRLPAVQEIGNDEKENGTWERLVLIVHAAALEEKGDLVGVSVDLTPWSDLLSSPDEAQRILNDICTRLRIFRLLLLSVGQYHIRIDLTGLPYPLSREHSQALTQTLKNIICCNVSEEELEQLHISECDGNGTNQIQTIAAMANDPSSCSLRFTADVSDHLVARAGALCTRIIGVKNGKGFTQDGRDEDVKEDAIAKHYYIDDGCYGSLGSDESKPDKKHLPVPLYGGSLAPKSTLALKKKYDHRQVSPMPANVHIDTSNQVKSTVWGPTCDGLDKVCDTVMLPNDLKANRDWLVFSNLGCGGFGGGLGLGTAFNGFDPPDVSYCVLGYFSYLE